MAQVLKKDYWRAMAQYDRAVFELPPHLLYFVDTFNNYLGGYITASQGEALASAHYELDDDCKHRIEALLSPHFQTLMRVRAIQLMDEHGVDAGTVDEWIERDHQARK